MNSNKNWKYYLKFYALIVVVYFIYVSILAIRDGGYNEYALLTVLYLPPLFIGFMFVFDRLLDPVFRRLRGGKRRNQDAYQLFLNEMTAAIQTKIQLSIEGFRRLRENAKFQKALQQAYRIYNQGETEELNFILLSKKFKKNTEEHDALSIVIEEVRRHLENQ